MKYQEELKMEAPRGSSDAGNTDPDYTEDELRLGMELLLCAYRDFIAEPDAILKEHNFGRAHHRVIHFVGRNPNITVSDLLTILKITKQSLSRVLSQLIREGYIEQNQGQEDRRQRLLSLTKEGASLEQRLSADQRQRISEAFLAAGPEAVEGFRNVLIRMINDQSDFKNFAQM